MTLIVILSGDFDQYLGGYAQQNDATGLIGATSNSVKTTQTASDNKSDSGSLSMTVIICIAVGGALAVLLLACLMYFLCVRKNHSKQHGNESVQMEDVEAVNPISDDKSLLK